MNIPDPFVNQYFIYSDENFIMPVKVIKRINTGYLCRHGIAMRYPLLSYRNKKCLCSCKSKCIISNLICLDGKGLKQQLDPLKGFGLVGR